ncbi:hypothetical protein ABT090_25275 [Streptomyces asoensis]|uniref:hypothetical protein n=1 Tax=Streptomyces asoensis TaxID=249586 RepID=UPI00332EF414
MSSLNRTNTQASTHAACILDDLLVTPGLVHGGRALRSDGLAVLHPQRVPELRLDLGPLPKIVLKETRLRLEILQ